MTNKETVTALLKAVKNQQNRLDTLSDETHKLLGDSRRDFVDSAALSYLFADPDFERDIIGIVAKIVDDIYGDTVSWFVYECNFDARVYIHDVEVSVNIDNFYDYCTDPDFMQDKVAQYKTLKPSKRITDRGREYMVVDSVSGLIRNVKLVEVTNDCAVIHVPDKQYSYQQGEFKKLPYDADTKSFRLEEYRLQEVLPSDEELERLLKTNENNLKLEELKAAVSERVDKFVYNSYSMISSDNGSIILERDINKMLNDAVANNVIRNHFFQIYKTTVAYIIVCTYLPVGEDTEWESLIDNVVVACKNTQYN